MAARCVLLKRLQGVIVVPVLVAFDVLLHAVLLVAVVRRCILVILLFAVLISGSSIGIVGVLVLVFARGNLARQRQIGGRR